MTRDVWIGVQSFLPICNVGVQIYPLCMDSIVKHDVQIVLIELPLIVASG